RKTRCVTELRGYGVADQFGVNPLELRLQSEIKSEVVRDALQSGPFVRCERPSCLGMGVSTSSRRHKARRDSPGREVPLEPPVNRCVAGPLPMAIRPYFVRQIVYSFPKQVINSLLIGVRYCGGLVKMCRAFCPH